MRTTAEKIGTTLGNLAVQTGFAKPSKAQPRKKAATRSKPSPGRSKKTVAKKAASKPASKKRVR